MSAHAVLPDNPRVNAAKTEACLYCGSTNLAPLYSKVTDRLNYVPGERSFLRCRECDSAVLSPLPKTEDLPGFYPPVYSFTLELGKSSRFKRLLSRAEYRFFFRPQYTAQVRSVMRMCGWRRGSGRKLLDVGCGRGLRLLEFRRLGFEVHGLDVQAHVVRYLNEELSIPAKCADVSELNSCYPSETFDLITTFFLIEHIPNVREALAGMFDLLKPGGWLAAAVPFVDSVQARAFGPKWINVMEAPRHLTLPTQKGMIAACRAVGFEKVTIVPDSTLNCAGQIASSLIPGATLTHVYGQSRLLPLLARAMGAGVMFASVPWCFFENRILKRTSLGIVIAQKPGG